MNRTLQKWVAAAMLGLALAGPAAGCAGPQRRPGPSVTSDSVARSVAKVKGTGAVAAVVLGETALVAIQLDAPVPGGVEGRSLTGNLYGGPAGRPGDGPLSQPVPNGNAGASPALPGGTISPGGSTPGGSPSFEQAVPNGKGGLATINSPNSPSVAPSSVHTAPIDVMNKAANVVLAENPGIREVRFATVPADAVRLQAIAHALQQGEPVTRYTQELTAMNERAFSAGMASMQIGHPPQGSHTITPRR